MLCELMTAQVGKEPRRKTTKLKPALNKNTAKLKIGRNAFLRGKSKLVILQPSSSITLIAFDLHSLEAIRGVQEDFFFLFLQFGKNLKVVEKKTLTWTQSEKGHSRA